MAANRNLRLSPEEYGRRLWDWTALNVCFAHGIRVSDIDGIVERRGSFLVLEGTRAGLSKKKGQQMMLEALARLPGFTVIMIEGNPPFEVKRWRVIGARISGTGSDSLIGYISFWFRKVDCAQGDGQPGLPVVESAERE